MASPSAGGNDLAERKRDREWGQPHPGTWPGQHGTGRHSVQVPTLGNRMTCFLLITSVLTGEASHRLRVGVGTTCWRIIGRNHEKVCGGARQARRAWSGVGTQSHWLRSDHMYGPHVISLGRQPQGARGPGCRWAALPCHHAASSSCAS